MDVRIINSCQSKWKTFKTNRRTWDLSTAIPDEERNDIRSFLPSIKKLANVFSYYFGIAVNCKTLNKIKIALKMFIHYMKLVSAREKTWSFELDYYSETFKSYTYQIHRIYFHFGLILMYGIDTICSIKFIMNHGDLRWDSKLVCVSPIRKFQV